MKAAGRQESVYLETYFITFRSLFARPSRGIPSCHELTSTRYAIFAAGLATILRGAALRGSPRLYALILKTIFYSGQSCTARARTVCCTSPCFAVYISRCSFPSIHGRRETLERTARRSDTQMECVTPRAYRGREGGGRVYVYPRSMCHENYSAITHKTIPADANSSDANARIRANARERANTRRVMRSRGSTGIALISIFVEEPAIIAAPCVNPRLPYRLTRNSAFNSAVTGEGTAGLGKRMSDNFLRLTISQTS